MPPGDGKLKAEDEIILAVILSIVGFAILSFTYYKIRTHTRRLKLREDLERNGVPPGGGVGGGGGGGGGRGLGGMGVGMSRGLDGDGDEEKRSFTAANLAPKLSTVTTAADSRSRRSAASGGSDSGADVHNSTSSKEGGREPRLYVEHKVELPGDYKAPDEIDGISVSAAKNKHELEGSGPPVELPVEPMRFSWAGFGTGTGTGIGTGTMGSLGTTNSSMTRSPSAVSDATTLFRYSHRPSYALRTPFEDAAEEGEEEEARKRMLSSNGNNTRLTTITHNRGSNSALGYRDGEVSPLSPGPRSVRAFSLDGTVVEAQLNGVGDGTGELAAANSAPATATMTGTPIAAVEPAALRRDKWKVWRALGEDTRRRH